MDATVNILRRLANGNTFIASSYFTSYLYHPEGTNWMYIGRLFNNPIALNRGDGLYIIPSFVGASDFGHWYVNLVHIQVGQARGYALDSLGTNYGPWKSYIRQKIMHGFSIPSLQYWSDIPILLQTELECGPRSIWNMLILCIARNHHITLNNIFTQIRTLGGISRLESSNIVRNDVHSFLSTQSGTALFSRLFSSQE